MKLSDRFVNIIISNCDVETKIEMLPLIEDLEQLEKENAKLKLRLSHVENQLIEARGNK